jgi:hypothetical protein
MPQPPPQLLQPPPLPIPQLPELHPPPPQLLQPLLPQPPPQPLRQPQGRYNSRSPQQQPVMLATALTASMAKIRRFIRFPFCTLSGRRRVGSVCLPTAEPGPPHAVRQSLVPSALPERTITLA